MACRAGFSFNVDYGHILIHNFYDTAASKTNTPTEANRELVIGEISADRRSGIERSVTSGV